MADSRIGAALEVARERFLAMSEGDTERFEATHERHEAACAALEPLRSSTEDANIQAVGELIALEQQTLDMLRQAAAETGTQLAGLRTGGKTAAAYRSAL